MNDGTLEEIMDALARGHDVNQGLAKDFGQIVGGDDGREFMENVCKTASALDTEDANRIIMGMLCLLEKHKNE